MPVNITGSKYSGTITSASNSLQLQNSAASFTQSDFSPQRIVGLWTSAGVYKGVAWIRRYLSSQSLELKTPFISDSGSVVTQTVGDKYLVSKNFNDSLTTGISLQENFVSITDNIIFGTAGISDAVCFYDENYIIRANIPNADKRVLDFRGGLCVFGHLQNYADRTFSNSCSLVVQSKDPGRSTAQVTVRDQSAKVWWMGGAIIVPAVGYIYGGNGGEPAEWQKWWGVQTNGDIVSPGDGGNWSARPEKQEIVNTNSSVSGQNAIAMRWGNGRIEGGTFKLSGTIALSIFGSDAAGTFNIGAPAGRFIEIPEVGTGTVPALWRSNSNITQTINFTNVVSPNRKLGFGAVPGPGATPNNNATGNFYFSGLYEKLINGTLAIVARANLGSNIVDSTTVSNTTATLTIQEAVVIGHTETVTENTWRYGFWLYGYDPASATFSTQTVDLGSVGTAKKVAFGGVITQLPDLDISQTNLATVLAYTSINTLDRLYDIAQAWKVNSVANAIYPSLDSRLISSSSSELNSVFATVIIDSTLGSTFVVNTSTNTLGVKTSTLTAGTKNKTWKNVGGSFEFRQTGTFSAFRFQSNTVKCAASTSFVGSTFATSTVDNLSALPITITVDASQLSNITVANPTTGGGAITLQSPPQTLRLFGIPNVAGAILRVVDLSNNAESFPVLVNGEVTINVVEGRQYRLRADAPGYLASGFVTVTGGTVTEYQFNLTNFRALYDSGTSRSSALVFDPATLTITIKDSQASYSFADVFRTLEDYLASPQGLVYTAHPFPVVLSDRNILQFPYDTAAGTINPARIKPDPANTTDPTLLFEVFFEGATDPTYSGFDFTGANGRIIRVRSVVAIAQGGGSASINPQQVRDAMALALSVGTTAATGSIDSELQAAKNQASVAALNTQI